MPGPLFLAGESVDLHTIEEEDLEVLQTWINDPAVRAGLGTTDPVTSHQEREWWESTAEDDDVHLLVCADGEAVGTVGLNDVIETAGTAEVGYFFGPESWGQGYATDAVRTLCRHGFDERRLAKLYAHVFETNPASARVLEKAGFVEEGRFRDQWFHDGERIDVLRYGLLPAELTGPEAGHARADDDPAGGDPAGDAA